MKFVAVEVIGYVRNDVKSPVDHGWADVESKIVLNEKLAPCLDGLADFSHALITYFMHQAPPPAELKRRPQGREDMPEVGLFAQRSRHRPNQIAISAVSVVKIDGHELIVRGLDAIDGTPVLDVKPYYPQYDSRPEAQVPEWVSRLMADYF